MSKYKLVFVALVAVGSFSTIAFAEENRGIAEQKGRMYSRCLQTLRRLHS